MRVSILLFASALVATPAVAQSQDHADEQVRVPDELTDPQTVERLSDMMQALSKAVLSLPVGEIRAAAEGREATPAEKNQTVRDLGRIDDPEFEQNLERQLADAKPALEAGMKALAEALPAMMKGMSAAAESLERATANLPSPTYPKR